MPKPCNSCKQLKLKLRTAQDENYQLQEVYLVLKQKQNDEGNHQKSKLNALVNKQQQLQIQVEELQQEKKVIMKKLVETMVAYDKETSEAFRENQIDDHEINFYQDRNKAQTQERNRPSYQP